MEGQQGLARASQGAFLFVINGEPSIEATNSSPGPVDHEQRSGRKRPHVKSRSGCLVCKRRRVKCDEQFPCSNCLKRDERCLRSKSAGGRSTELSTSISQPQLTSMPVVDDTSINLLHLELFSHFQRDLVDTLRFSKMWQQVLPRSFQEPYIMCAILCLAATHLSTLRPQASRYSDVAVQLLAKLASLFSERVSCAVTAQDSEALIAVSILMHYISWSHIEFIEKQGQVLSHEGKNPLSAHLSSDPLLQLSFGVKGILYKAFHILSGSDSVFLTAGLYSPRHVIEEAILQQGDDPWRFVDHFMGIANDPRYQPLLTMHDNRHYPPPNTRSPLRCPFPNRHNNDAPVVSEYRSADPQQMAFEGVSKRLSLLFCLVSMSASNNPSASRVLLDLQPDVGGLFFSFPIHYSGIFRESAMQGDPRALILLCHFYRAARILLTSRGTWWAQQRSRVIESLLLQELAARGLETCILGE
ncbi:hypothetical protein F4825DRAFT_427982 [Nemania diffusa]|nr:hypothetical protein F4825DRAFT_427982 [Nemania diffusa]